ncbi:MAG: diaminopimelate decarboxylase [Eubacteriales bacterium]|nr:diaminopimelate decarboxylase [Eubacteriales bacterium]
MEAWNNYFGNTTPTELLETYGSPLYVYNEEILRRHCNELKTFCPYENFVIDYSMKANFNPSILKIAREEGLEVDAMSVGEMKIAEMAGYTPDEIFFVCNNVGAEEMQYAIDRGIRISVDSLSQLELFGKLSPNSKIAIRVNPGVGAGHHEKVVTAGKATKFGITMDSLDEIYAICEKYNLTIAGINQHIGSLFLEGDKYLSSIESLFTFCKNFKDLDFIDFGGGFGIPYQKGVARLDLKDLGQKMNDAFEKFCAEYGRKIQFRVEPGRYVAAESSCILGTVHAVKNNYEKTYVGTDVGFNVLVRPIMYDSFHEIELYKDGKLVEETNGNVATIVGNICESGDILGKDRPFPVAEEGDIVCVRDAGAYGHVMSSNYNGRLRPAEVMITTNGEAKIIRKRDTYEQLMENYVM